MTALAHRFDSAPRLSRHLPKPAALTSVQGAAHGWEVAAVGYATAIWVYVVGYLIVSLANLPGGFRLDLESVFSRNLLIAAPATLTVITLATRRREAAGDAGGRWLVDATLTLCVPLGALFVVAGLVGFLADFGDFGTSASGTLYAMCIHVGGVVLGAVAARWALVELAGLDEPASGASA